MAQERLNDAALTERIGFTPSCLQSWLSSAPLISPLLHQDYHGQLAHYSPGEAIANTLNAKQLEGRHPLDKAQYVWIKTQFESQVLGWAGDRVDMANSLEARPAFLDHPLVEFAVTIPPSLRFRDRKDKYILRETMKALLPETLYNRQKFAFMAPPAHTDPVKQQAMVGLANRYLSPAAIAQAGLLDATAVTALLERHQHSSTPVAEQVQLDAMINHLLSVQILHEQFIAADVPTIALERARTLGWQPATVAA